MFKGRLARGRLLRGSRPLERVRKGRSLLGAGVALVLAAMVVVSTAGADHSVVDLVSKGPAGGDGAFDVSFEGASEDGSRIFFSTEESLVGRDHDQPCLDIFGTPAPCRDVYQYSGGTTSLLSNGPVGGNGPYGASFDAASQDGSRVYFSTRERLVLEDQDPPDGCLDVSGAPSPCRDIYLRTATATTLVSTGPTGGNDNEDVEFNAISRDGGRVFFTTQEPLVAADTDRELDVYTHKDGITRRISAGPIGGNGEPDATFEGASGDGTRVFFSTDEALTRDDTDCGDGNCNEDVYERRGVSTTTLISKGPASDGADLDAQFEGSSRDGRRVFFSTREALVAADADPIDGCESRGAPAPCRDIYENNAGTVSLVSAGGNGAFDASFDATTEDGSRVFFATREGLVDADRDEPAAGEPGCGADTAPEPCRDIYERSDGSSEPRLISIGPTGGSAPFEASFDAVSQDGTRVFFGTEEALVPADRDPADACSDSSGNPTPCRDIYERRDGTTTLISTGPAGGDGAFDASFAGISQDGTRAFFSTDEVLTRSDTDPPDACTDSGGDPSSCRDVYERSGFATTLISTGPTGGSGAFNASFEGSTPDGTRVYFTTAEALVSRDGDGSVDLYTARPGADLSLSMSDSPDPVTSGQTLTYTLFVENHGALDTGSVRVTDPLPAGVSFQSASASQGSCAESAGTVTCSLGGLANGDRATVEIRVIAQTAGALTNFASVEGSEADPSAANNSASVATTVNAPPPPPPPPPAGGAAPAAAAGAGPPAPVAVKDTVAPALAVFSRSKDKLSRVLSKGLRVTVRCLEACRVQVALELDSRSARRLKLASKIGRGSARLAAGERERITVKLSRKAKRRLARSRSKIGRRIKLRLRTTASDAAGNDRTVRGRVTLER